MGAYTELSVVVENGNIVIPAESVGGGVEGEQLRLRVEVLPVDPTQTEQEAKIADEMAYFVAHHAELRQQYENEFVAIHQRRVVDHDKNRISLRNRIRNMYGKKAILITPVTETPVQEFVVRSPRLVRHE